MSIRISVILENQQATTLSIHPDDSVLKALEILSKEDIGALAVVEDGKVVGIFSERDFVKRVIIPKKDYAKLKIREVMTTELFCGSPDWDMEECLRLMNEKQVRHIPIVDNGQLVACLSILDVVKGLLSVKQSVIINLENAVSGNWPF